MIYYPVVGDICFYESPSDNQHYLVMDVREEDFLNRKQIVAHLLCLDSGEHFPDYFWPVDNLYWHKVA